MNFNIIIKWIWNNLNAIKDILWIVFTLIATIITILTYRKARYTILQPLRTEVIKKQTELIIDIMNLFKSDNDLLNQLDYVNIICGNAYLLINEYGFILKNEIDIEDQKKLDEMFVGFKVVNNSQQLNDIEVIQAFNDKEKKNNISKEEIAKSKYENLQKGIIDIALIEITKNYKEFQNKIINILENPFLPLEIKKSLEEIINIDNANFKIIKIVLEKFLLDLMEKRKNKEEFSILPMGVYNNFNRQKLDNMEVINKLRNTAREYLMIDRKWK